ncbi:MAG: LysE family transporter [Acidimicrobiales bacterium]|nr:LysE family transporter [Acidimicrobiales bacterium]
MVLLFGFLTGLALVAPIGPVSLTLVGLGAEQGRRAALAGAGGVVLADVATVPIALGGAGLLARLDAGIVRDVETVLGLLLVAVAITTVLRAEQARHAIASLRRPTRTLAALTACNPLSLAAWSGLALALPPSISAPRTLVVFGLGLVLASAVWHSSLAAASGTFASRLGARSRTALTRASGGLMLVIGGVLVL